MSFMTKLYFTNPEFDYDEINVTVRLGDKWADAGVIAGEAVELVETGSEAHFGVAEWRGYMVTTVEQLRKVEGILVLEHDPDCRTYDGLIAELCSVYDLGEINADQILTVVFFTPREPSSIELNAA